MILVACATLVWWFRATGVDTGHLWHFNRISKSYKYFKSHNWYKSYIKVKSGGSQMVGLCLVLEFHWGGSATNSATRLVYRYLYIYFNRTPWAHKWYTLNYPTLPWFRLYYTISFISIHCIGLHLSCKCKRKFQQVSASQAWKGGKLSVLAVEARTL